ncbi:MAG TPA: Rieske 2Fe-2S domain-containing protein [Chloroflexota bacterium]
MLTTEDNDLLTRIGPGTPMGNLLRQYWLPVLMSSELPEDDGAPKRVRILGEDLIGFRTTTGQVGLLANNCSHRGASLFFGRNEEDGLRCVYHGWKYDVLGHCVDMPNEPPETSFADRIRHQAYPCREQSGVIWTYMGPRQDPPPLPDLEWMTLPAAHFKLSKTLRESNWAQALEGDFDNAHVSFLHSRLQIRSGDGLASRIMNFRKAPYLDVVETEYGVMYCARRDANEQEYNYRIIQFMFPNFALITTGGPGSQGIIPGDMWVPIDDENTMLWGVDWNPTDPLKPDPDPDGSQAHKFLPNGTGWLDQWQPVANMTNDYLLDYEIQKNVQFSGIPTIELQDKGITESMGRIFDRTFEHLGTTDAMVVKIRERLIAAAKALRDEGVTPPGVDRPELYRLRSAIVNLPRDVDWVEATREIRKSHTGVAASSTV